jgi:hypothetical protein
VAPAKSLPPVVAVLTETEEGPSSDFLQETKAAMPAVANKPEMTKVLNLE